MNELQELEKIKNLEELIAILKHQEDIVTLMEEQETEIKELKTELTEKQLQIQELTEELDETQSIGATILTENQRLRDMLKASEEQKVKLLQQISELKSLKA